MFGIPKRLTSPRLLALLAIFSLYFAVMYEITRAPFPDASSADERLQNKDVPSAF